MKRTKTGLILTLLGLLCGCDFSGHRDYHDPALKLQKEDYEKITKLPCEQITPPSFCPKAPCSPKPPPLTPAMRKKLSLSLQETIPLKSAFIEIGRQAGVNIVLSPKITQESIELLCQRERKREEWEIEHYPKGEIEEIRQIYKEKGFKGDFIVPLPKPRILKVG